MENLTLEQKQKLGEALRAQREKANISIESVSNILKIRKKYLEYIEIGQFDKLPGNVYHIAYLKCYAQFLQLDIAPYLAEREMPPKEQTTEEQSTPPVSTTVKRKLKNTIKIKLQPCKTPSWFIVGSSIVLLIMALLFFNS